MNLEDEETPAIPDCASEQIVSKLRQAERVWLFLDYDGTLADFAPTPDYVKPNPEVLELLDKLNRQKNIRLTVVSGRRLEHIRALLPLKGILLAGTYGVELLTASGGQFNRLDYATIRPTLEKIKPQWESLLSGRQGFFLEDKGWSLAIHGKDAPDGEADQVLSRALEVAEDASRRSIFRILGGHKFLEIGPKLANKGKAVKYILEKEAWEDALYIYIGDDDKDEEAFGIIQERGGLAMVVAPESRISRADCRLDSPRQVRQWLRDLPGYLK
jgi:trehalose 6-phosphate phosphatase